MKYEKPIISFQKFYADTFLDNEDLKSGNSPSDNTGDVFEEDGTFTSNTEGFNGTITINSDGVGGWFNG